MTRPLRLEFPGALYHITARGDRRTVIYVDHADRLEWLNILAEVCSRFNFIVPAYCEMSNHYHLMIETPDGNLSQGMRRLNSIYSQYFNRRHQQVGHVFQGRYKAILVQKENYLLELTRYIILNPVRAKFVSLAEDWAWSSYQATLGKAPAPTWLDTGWLLSQFGNTHSAARAAYGQFVAAGEGTDSPLKRTQHQLVLGDDDFIKQHLQPLEVTELTAVCRDQRRMTAMTLENYAAKYPDRTKAMAEAYFSTAYTMIEIGDHFGVSYQTVSRAVRRHEIK
jgi:REP element-mobilizing transposase RayT